MITIWRTVALLNCESTAPGNEWFEFKAMIRKRVAKGSNQVLLEEHIRSALTNSLHNQCRDLRVFGTVHLKIVWDQFGIVD